MSTSEQQPITTVLFDCDGVLVDSQRASIKTYQNLFIRAGYGYFQGAEIAKAYHLTFDKTIELLIGVVPSDDESTRLRNLIADPRIRATDLFEFPEEVDTVLAELDEQYVLGLVTSRSRLGIDDVFKAKDLRRYFACLVTSEDCMKPKPSPGPLLRAVELLGCQACEAVYVGDSDSDIQAAIAANMRSVFVGAVKHDRATVSIQKLAQLPASLLIIERL